MRLIWYQRKDGFWNAACACGATLAGFSFEYRADAEVVHSQGRRAELRQRDALGPFAVFARREQDPPCGPKLPEPNPNSTDPLVFA